MGDWGPDDEALHPRGPDGQWVDKLLGQLFPHPNLVEGRPPVPGDQFFETRMAIGGESEEPAAAIADNIDHYRNRTEIYNPETGQWGVLGDAWLRDENDFTGIQDTVIFTIRGGGHFQLYIDNEGDDFGTVRVRPIRPGT